MKNELFFHFGTALAKDSFVSHRSIEAKASKRRLESREKWASPGIGGVHWTFGPSSMVGYRQGLRGLRRAYRGLQIPFMYATMGIKGLEKGICVSGYIDGLGSRIRLDAYLTASPERTK